jgi:hypothetical protein
MSTRSNIIIKHPVSGQFASVYCHSDGYVSGNGQILFEHYNSLTAAASIIALGGISSLGSSLDNTRDYHRWRNEDIEIYVSNCLSDHVQEEYGYLFADGMWYVNSVGRGWQELEAVLRNLDTDIPVDLPYFQIESMGVEDTGESVTMLDWAGA